MARTQTNVKLFNKFCSKCFVNRLWGEHNKLNAVAGSQVKHFGYTELSFYLVQFIRQIFLTDNQLAQLLQLNLFMRKSYYL